MFLQRNHRIFCCPSTLGANSFAKSRPKNRHDPHRIGNNSSDCHCSSSQRLLQNRTEPLSLAPNVAKTTTQAHRNCVLGNIHVLEQKWLRSVGGWCCWCCWFRHKLTEQGVYVHGSLQCNHPPRTNLMGQCLCTGPYTWALDDTQQKLRVIEGRKMGTAEVQKMLQNAAKMTTRQHRPISCPKRVAIASVREMASSVSSLAYSDHTSVNSRFQACCH